MLSVVYPTEVTLSCLAYSSASGTLSGEFEPLSEPPVRCLPLLVRPLLSAWPPAWGTVGEAALWSTPKLTGWTEMPWLCCMREPLGGPPTCL